MHVDKFGERRFVVGLNGVDTDAFVEGTFGVSGLCLGGGTLQKGARRVLLSTADLRAPVT